MPLLKIIDQPSLIDHRVLNSNTSVETQKIVQEIIDSIKHHGDEALIKYTNEFDHVTISSVVVPSDEIKKAEKNLDDSIRNLLNSAIEKITNFHQFQNQKSWQKEYEDGSILGEKVTAMDRVGIYVPGGKAFYPSTMIMNTIPAQIAGVPSIVIASPPGDNGLPHHLVLAIASMLDIKEVVAVGGAQAVAALAYGTPSIKPVVKITGPGNRFVAEAKRQVFGKVGIDSIAGPSEIVILHDDPSIPTEFLVRDLLTQAEHDEDARAVLITTLKSTANEVQKRIDELIEDLPRKEIIRTSLIDHGSIMLVDSIEKGCELVNEIAPEHLEVMVKDKSILNRISNAGAIFVGRWSTETIGDYYAGPNHTIPTAGAAKFGSPLSVRDFQKHSSIIEYSEKRLKNEADTIAQFAELEGLFAHAEAIKIRK